MRIARIIGTVVLGRSHATFAGARLRLAVPLSLSELTSGALPQAEPLVLWDELGAGIGSQVALSEGPEAARAFHPDIRPVDAYAAALLDTINIDPDEAARIAD